MRKRQMTLEDAIALLKEKYEKNKENGWIENPVAYTLYEVWKTTDQQRTCDRCGKPISLWYPTLCWECDRETTMEWVAEELLSEGLCE